MRKIVLGVALLAVFAFFAMRALVPTPSPMADAYARVKDRVPAGQALFVLWGTPG